MGITLTEAVAFHEASLEDIHEYEICRGKACIITQRSPDKETSNEDSLALIPCDKHSGLLVVADGLGGMRYGDRASKEVISKLTTSVSRGDADCSSLRENILDGIEKANESIITAADGAASTVALVEIQQSEIRPYQVGDSAVLVTGQRGKVKYQSVPHSPVGYAVEAGMLEADDAIHHEDRHLISNAVGINPMHIEIGPKLRLAQRDTLLVASDGVFDNLHINEIVDIIRKGPLLECAQQLMLKCQYRMTHYEADLPHHPDDMSFILYRQN